MEYLKKFNNNESYEDYMIDSPKYPNVSLVGDTVSFNDLRNKVGAYVYKDYTLGTEVGVKPIIGVIVIPAFATNNGRARWMPINMLDINSEFDGDSFEDNYNWYVDDLADITTHWNDLHSNNKYPYINNGTTITNKIQGIGDSSGDDPHYVYMWVELSASDKANKDDTSTVITSPNNSNLCYISLNSRAVGSLVDESEIRILPEPYLTDGSLNPIYKVPGTITTDWNHSNLYKILAIGSSPLFEFVNRYYINITDGYLENFYIPTINEIILFYGKFNTIKLAIINAGYECSFDLNCDHNPGSSTLSYINGGDSCAWKGSLNSAQSYTSWGTIVDNSVNPLFFREF